MAGRRAALVGAVPGVPAGRRRADGAPSRPRLATGDPGAVEQRLAAELDTLELLPYYDSEAALAPADEVARRARAIGAEELEMRAKLVLADVNLRAGKTAVGGQIAIEVNRWASQYQHNFLLCRSHRLLCTFFDRVGDFAGAFEHGLKAVELMPESVPPRIHVGHLMGLAQALVRIGSYDEARERYMSADGIVDTLNDVDLKVHLLNDLAWLEHDAGQARRSLDAAERMVAYALAHGVTLPASALDSVARAQMSMGRYAEAEHTLAPVIARDDSTLLAEEFSGLGETLLTVAEIQRLRGHLESARVTLQRAARLIDQGELGSVRVQLRLQQAELAAAEGDYKLAFEQHKEFHAEAERLYSIQREARARTLQAVFETAEARREGERFREMSLRDPLTGLRNRRFVDDRLPVLLRQALDDHTPLSIGLADLDFFKTINDTLSHDVGDEVLRRVASILTDGVEHGFVARLGGEEFLLVFTGTSLSEATARLESIRQAVATYPWEELTHDVPVSISIGATNLYAGRTTQSALLGQADRNLYAAKHAGRNQVVAE